MNHHVNITRIKAVSNALQQLKTNVVFAGGAVVSLYADASFRQMVRPTDDVDVVVELASYHSYSLLDEALRKLGFENDAASKVICRYKYNGLTVDVMPTDEKVLGFSNKWYKPAFALAVEFVIDEKHVVKIFPVIYFIASKLEAFKSRGANDGRTSSDFEDIVYVLNYRAAIWKELSEASNEIRSYLKHEFSKLLNKPFIYEWISCHLDFDEQRRVDFIIHSLEEFVNSNV